MCNRYWDLYECRWQDYTRAADAALGTDSDAAADQLGETLVPEPRSEAAPGEVDSVPVLPVS